MSLLLLALAIITPAPRDTVRYAVTFPDPTHHETRIAVDFPAAGDTLEVWMSRSSPGRYALHEFAVAGQEDWTALLAAHVPGDSIRLVLQQRGARSGRFCDSRPIRGWRCARPNSRG